MTRPEQETSHYIQMSQSAQRDDGYSNCVAGFDGQTYYDPVLSSSLSIEQLIQVRAHSGTPSFLINHVSSYGDLARQVENHPNGPLPSTFGLANFTSNGGGEVVHSPGALQGGVLHPGTYPRLEDAPMLQDGMSPANGFRSEYDYADLNDYVAQDIENKFLLDDYSALHLLTEDRDMSLALSAPSGGPASTTTALSQAPTCTSRTSTGLATHSSQLISPVLTATASPGSGTEVMISPLLKGRLLGGGTMSRISSRSTATESAYISYRAGHEQHTPALTGTSVEASPESVRGTDIMKVTSPIVRVESYSRGDSPARSAGVIRRHGSKRSRGSRSSFHLAAPDESSSEDVCDDEHGHSGRSRILPELRVGLDPDRRLQVSEEFVPNLQDQEETTQLGVKNAQISSWLATSEVTEISAAESTPTAALKHKTQVNRQRAKSTSDQREFDHAALQKDNSRLAKQSAQIPGPGILLEEESENDDEDGEDVASRVESATASASADFMTAEASIHYPDDSAGEFKPHDAYPWIDPIYVHAEQDTAGQPTTSNAAMARFIKRAADIETASRAATWGTSNHRRLSEADLEKVFGQDGFLSRLTISRDKGKEKGERRGSFLDHVEYAASKILPKRNNSIMKRKASEPTKPGSGIIPASSEYCQNVGLQSRKDSVQSRKVSLHERKESLGNRSGSPSISVSLKRIPSAGKRSRSPMVNTGGAVATIATQIAALGSNGSVSPVGGPSPTSAWDSTRNVIKRTARDFHRPSSNDKPGLVDLWNKQGGPPLPTLTTPEGKKEEALTPVATRLADDDVDNEKLKDQKGVSLDFTPRQDLPIPTLEGFKMNVRDVNPRLGPYLVDRLGQEQLRRYKKLVEFKIRHAQARQNGNCPSGSQCNDTGGLAVYFAANASQMDPVPSFTGFSIVQGGDIDEDTEAAADGAVTAAQFPPGVPLPPVKRLPAQFECPLCFSVKNFTKPSDWSKHVHEDLQPFTCTFPTCPDPKSFKRKADWVRHENERHRQLEWWTCNEDGCSHQCYRRDNFVQHLVREHKMPEPKAKNSKPNKPAVRGPAKNKVRVSKDAEMNGILEDRVLTMVETCRYVTPKNPHDEPCRFCGNICNSWKKLTVHLAKHMEQISMPILELVRQKDVSHDTIISPIEQKILPQSYSIAREQAHCFLPDSASISPFDLPADIDHNVKQELPGSFTPMENLDLFSNVPVHEHQMVGASSWGQNFKGTFQRQPKTSESGYAPQLENTYVADQGIHQDPKAPQFLSTNVPANIVHPSADPMYNLPNGQLIDISQASYAGPERLLVGAGRPTPFVTHAAPQYINHSNAPISQPQISIVDLLPISYDPRRIQHDPHQPSDYREQQQQRPYLYRMQ